jgi:flagellar biosynthesis/type III secretory pathway chaperone
VESITELLASEISFLQRFCALLDEERKALTGAKAEDLPRIAEEKSTLATRLSALESSRDSLLKKSNSDSGRTGMDAWLKTCANPTADRAQWNRLLDLAAKARSENETNGRLINLLLKQNQDALAVLLSSGGGSIYGPDGQQRSLGGGRSFGSV